jgi:hypothetical protein
MEVGMIKISYTVAVCLLLSGVAIAQEEWNLVGFSGCSVQCVAQHPADTAIMYIAIDDTVYRSTDGGETWTYAVSFYNLPVNGLLFHPVEHDMICALVGDGSWSDGIYYSTDGGYVWDVLFYFYKPLTLCIPEDTSSLWVVGCDTFGVYKSTDNGMTWALWNEGLTNLHINSLSHTWRSDTLVFLAGTGQGLFYRNTDSWSLADGISDMLPVVSIIHHPIAAYGYAAVGNGSYSDGIYMTTDYGETWQVSEWWVFPSCVTMTEMWDYPRDMCTVLAGDSGLGVKQSQDFGSTWYEMNAGLDDLFINVLSYHRLNAMRLFAGTEGGLYRFLYESGCEEHNTPIHASFIVQPTIIRSGESIGIFCQMDANAVTDHSVYVLDVCGRVIGATNLENSTAEISLPVPCGIYFVQISGIGAQTVQKIIVVE